MRNRLSALCAALALLTVGLRSPALAAPKPALSKSQSAADVINPAHLDTFYREQMKKQNLVGLSLVVMQDGKIVATRCYGMASRETRQPVTPDTEFAVGSITKQFTAACILLLAEDGKLSVHDPVSKFYPALTRASDITLLDLMNHVSGYRDYCPMDFFEAAWAAPTTADAVIAQYAALPLDFEPGTRWSYSNTGYQILGRVVEKVSGHRLGEFMQARLFTPLGMNHTRYNPPIGTPGLPQGYRMFALSAPLKAPREADGWDGGDGALYSTPTDLAAWDLALMSGKVLKPESLAVMTTPRILKNGASTYYGAGQFITTRRGQAEWYHTGEVSGFISDNVMFPTRRDAFIITLNTDYGDLNSLVRHVTSVLPGPPAPAAKAPAPAKSVAAPSSPVPVVQGPSAEVVVRQMVAALEKGQVDRTRLGTDYSVFLTSALLHTRAQSLRGWGAPRTITNEFTEERGGMEASGSVLTFGKGKLEALMFRSPDGKVQEFLLSPVSD